MTRAAAVQPELGIGREDWPVVTFGDVVRNVKAKVDRDKNPHERYIAGEHMNTEDLHLRSWGEFGQDYVGPAFHREFRKGQILYGSRRTYLKKVAVADFDGVTANTTFVLETRDDKVLLQELLPFIMHSDAYTEHSVRESKGSTNPYVNWPDIAKYRFPLPPVDEQRRIAKLLWAADEVVERYRDSLDRTALARKVYFRERSDADREVNGGKHFKTVGDAIECIIAGKSPVGSSESAKNGKYGVLKVSAVGVDGYEPLENKALLDPSDWDPDYEVHAGFIMTTRANAMPSGVGRVCIVEDTPPGLMLSDKTLRLVPRGDVVRDRFLVQAMKSRLTRRYIEGRANGTEAKNISQARLKKAPIWLPPLDVQDDVLRVLFRFTTADHDLEAATRDATRIKAKMTQELIGGNQ